MGWGITWNDDTATGWAYFAFATQPMLCLAPVRPRSIDLLNVAYVQVAVA